LEESIVILKDNLTVQKAAEIKAQFLKALDKSNPIFLQFESINKIDLSFLQLVCAFHKSTLKQNKSLSITGTVPEIVKKTRENLGFVKCVGCALNNSCIWQDH